jgi:hypothetical protein
VHISILCGLLWSTAAIAVCPPDTDGKSRQAFATKDAPRSVAVSFSRLLARPDDFDRRRVLIYGILGGDGASYSLYSDSEAMKYYVLPSAIILDLSDESKLIACRSKGKYVLVEGVFVSRPLDTIVGHAGSLRNITRLWPLPSRDDKF